MQHIAEIIQEIEIPEPVDQNIWDDDDLPI